MRSQHLTVLVDEFTGARFIFGNAFDKSGVVAVGDKADILAVRLMSRYQAAVFAHPADLGFGNICQRQQDMRQLLLGQVKKHIALVFGVVVAAGQQPAVSVSIENDAGIVTGSQIFTVHQPGAIEQFAEFDVFIAVDAGVWRTAGFVFADKAVDDAVPEAGTEIKDIVGNAQLVCNQFSVFNVA